MVGSASDVDSAWTTWHGTLTGVIRNPEVVPRRLQKPRRYEPPWYSRNLRNMTNRMDAAFRAWLSSKSVENRRKYNRLRNSLKKAKAVARREYYAQVFTSKSPREFWDAVKRQRGKIPDQIPPLRRADGSFAVADDQKAELIADELDKHWNTKISQTKFELPPKCDPNPDFLVNCDWVYSQLMALNPNKSTGIDNIPVIVLQAVAGTISQSLTILINRCLHEGQFPDQWKHAIVSPIPKTDEKSDPSQYRPISLLPIVSKIAEKHFHGLILQCLESSGKLSDAQYGFRSGRSTVDAAALFQYYICSGFEECKASRVPTRVAAMFFDLRRAFDQVPHDLLLLNLQQEYDLHPCLLRLVSGYLAGRKQSIRVNHQYSKSHEVLSGIGQGTVLGPLLFISYINAIGSLPLSNGSHVILYADDLVLVKPILSAADETAFCADANMIALTFDNFKMTLNLSKCKTMGFSVAPRPPQFTTQLLVCGTVIERVGEYKYLGLIFDCRLTFKSHILWKIQSCRKELGVISGKLSKWVDPSGLRRIYQSTIWPNLTYGIEVWFPGPDQQGLIKLLERFNRRAAMVCLNDYSLINNYSSDAHKSLMTHLNWKSVTRFATERRATLIVKYVSNFRYLPTGILQSNDVVRVLRQVSMNREFSFKQLFKPNSSNRSKFSALNQMVSIWNVLDLSIAKFPPLICQPNCGSCYNCCQSRVNINKFVSHVKSPHFSTIFDTLSKYSDCKYSEFCDFR